MFDNGCEPTVEYPLDCSTFLNGVVQQGLHNGIVKYATVAFSLGKRLLDMHDGTTTVEVCQSIVIGVPSSVHRWCNLQLKPVVTSVLCNTALLVLV